MWNIVRSGFLCVAHFLDPFARLRFSQTGQGGAAAGLGVQILPGSAGTARQTLTPTVASKKMVEIYGRHRGGNQSAISPDEYGTLASIVINQPIPSASFSQSIVMVVWAFKGGGKRTV